MVSGRQNLLMSFYPNACVENHCLGTAPCVSEVRYFLDTHVYHNCTAGDVNVQYKLTGDNHPMHSYTDVYNIYA
jgi:hypothetical protein